MSHNGTETETTRFKASFVEPHSHDCAYLQNLKKYILKTTFTYNNKEFNSIINAKAGHYIEKNRPKYCYKFEKAKQMSS